MMEQEEKRRGEGSKEDERKGKMKVREGKRLGNKEEAPWRKRKRNVHFLNIQDKKKRWKI